MRNLYDVDSMRCLFQGYLHIVLEALASPVECNHEMMCATAYAECNFNVVAEHYGAYTKTVRSHR